MAGSQQAAAACIWAGQQGQAQCRRFRALPRSRCCAGVGAGGWDGEPLRLPGLCLRGEPLRPPPLPRLAGASAAVPAGWPRARRGPGSKFSVRRWPAVSTGVGAPSSVSLPRYQHGSPSAPSCPKKQQTDRSKRVSSRWHSTQGTEQPREPSPRKRRTTTVGPSLRRTQGTTLWEGTPCRRACCTQLASNLWREGMAGSGAG